MRFYIRIKRAIWKKITSENLKETISTKIKQVSKDFNINLPTKYSGLVEKISVTSAQIILSFSWGVISKIPDLIIDIIVFSLSMYLFLHYAPHIKKKILFFKLLEKNDLDELTNILQKSSFDCLVTLSIIGAIQAITVVIGSAIAGFNELFFIFVATFILSFIPIIGAAPVAFSLAVVKIFQHNTTMVIVLIITGIIAGSIDNVIKPILIKKGVELDGALLLIIIMGSIVVLGLPGLLIGPVVGTTVAYYFKKHSCQND